MIAVQGDTHLPANEGKATAEFEQEGRPPCRGF